MFLSSELKRMKRVIEAVSGRSAVASFETSSGGQSSSTQKTTQNYDDLYSCYSRVPNSSMQPLALFDSPPEGRFPSHLSSCCVTSSTSYDAPSETQLHHYHPHLSHQHHSSTSFQVTSLLLFLLS